MGSRAVKKAPVGESLLQEVFGGKLVGGTLSQLATYADLFTKMTDLVLLLDTKDHRVLEANPAAIDFLTEPERELMGCELEQWISEADRGRFKRLVQDAMRSLKSVGPVDVEVDRGGGDARVLELSVCRLRLADYCQVIQVVARDVTDVREARKTLEELTRKLERMSRTDEMTGLNNFRSFIIELQKEDARSRRYKTPYSLIFCDVDHFKKYNDQNGHPAGDDVLRKVAELLMKNRRDSDLPARYGGEEFVVLCPGVTAKEAVEFAERFRVAIESEKFPHGEKQPLGKVTISIGVASFVPDGAKSFQDVLEHADQALYASKSGGRNRVTAA